MNVSLMRSTLKMTATQETRLANDIAKAEASAHIVLLTGALYYLVGSQSFVGLRCSLLEYFA